jgi:photosystem II stability/assembly factor-like uncharacterized protein
VESDTVVVESEPQNGVNCGYTFRLEERYVVYAYASAGGPLTTNMCGGTKLASSGAADLAFLKEVTGPPRGVRVFGNVRRVEDDLVSFNRRDYGGVSGARVQVTGERASRESITAVNGSYDFRDLPPGTYKITVTPPKGLALNLSVGEDGMVNAVGDSGAFRWSREGPWQQIGPATTVADLVATPWGDVLAVAAGGLSHAEAAVGPWRKLPLGHDAHLSSQAPSGDANASLATITPQGDVLAATQGGVLRSRDRGETWRRVGLTHIVHSFLSTRSGVILAATENGVFRSNDAGENWVERSMGLTALRMHSLARASDGTVYAGTRDGDVFRSADEGDRWRPLRSPTGISRLHALVVLRNGHLLAGTNSGLSKWDPVSQAWRTIVIASDRGSAPVRALVQNARGAVFAGTEGRGFFRL